eukprot:m.144341 g.144341  ORF g.144341 m.144341 type:complete len:94 (-) comp30366_c7_seq1:18-299(-)
MSNTNTMNANISPSDPSPPPLTTPTNTTRQHHQHNNINSTKITPQKQNTQLSTAKTPSTITKQYNSHHPTINNHINTHTTTIILQPDTDSKNN